MKVMCSQCGKVLDLMMSPSFVVEEAGQLKSHYFCSDDHMAQYARKKGVALSKN